MKCITYLIRLWIFISLTCCLLFFTPKIFSQPDPLQEPDSLQQNGFFEKDQTIEIVGSENLQKISENQGGGFAANTGIGFLIKRNIHSGFWQKIVVEAIMNVTSTVDTLVWLPDLQNTRDFGNYILLPINSRERVSFQFTGHLGANQKISGPRKHLPFSLRNSISGIRFSVIASNRYWSSLGKTEKVSASSFRIGIFHDYIPLKDREEISIRLGLDISARFILGDTGLDSMKDFREKILGTPETTFWGLEPYLSLRLKNIQGEVSFPFLEMIRIGNRSFVPGLSGAQLGASIQFVGGFQLSF